MVSSLTWRTQSERLSMRQHCRTPSSLWASARLTSQLWMLLTVTPACCETRMDMSPSGTSYSLYHSATLNLWVSAFWHNGCIHNQQSDRSDYLDEIDRSSPMRKNAFVRFYHHDAHYYVIKQIRFIGLIGLLIIKRNPCLIIIFFSRSSKVVDFTTDQKHICFHSSLNLRNLT